MLRILITVIVLTAPLVNCLIAAPDKAKATTLAKIEFDRRNFNPENFAAQEPEYEKSPAFLSREVLDRMSQTDPTAAAAFEEIRKIYGAGPAWIVKFDRSKNVSKSGNWYDTQRAALLFLVFDDERVAVIDHRGIRHPSDTIDPKSKDN